MPSEKIVEVIAAITALQDRVKVVDAEAKRLAALRGDINSLSEGMSACSRELQSVATSLAAGAATMRELDMAATLTRITQIEEALDDRSDQLEKVIDKDIAELGDSILHQIATRLDSVATRLEPIVSTAFSGQMTAITGAVERAASAAQERHESSGQQLLLETGRITSGQAEFRQHFDDSITVVIDDVASVLGTTQAVLKEASELRQSIADLRKESIEPIVSRLEAQESSAQSSAAQLGQLVQQRYDSLGEKVLGVQIAAAIAAIAGVVAIIIALVR